MKIYLIGYRCTGKTSVGKILADILNSAFFDIDDEIQTRTSKSISEIVNTQGWEYFRALEKKTLFSTADKDNIVIATGGGIVLDIENRNFIKHTGLSIWLFADINVIIKRLKDDYAASISTRPSLTRHDLEQETLNLLCQRESLYGDITQNRINTSGKTVEEIAKIINRRIGNEWK